MGVILNFNIDTCIKVQLLKKPMHVDLMKHL